MAWAFLIGGIEEHFDVVNGDYPLFKNKWYLYSKGCIQYLGEIEDGSGTIDLIGGPFNESQCEEPYELIYHFIEGECGLQKPNDYYYRQVYLNNVVFEPQPNMWYSYDRIKSHDVCLKFIDKVENTGQSVGNVRLFTGGPYNSCDCENECYEFEECNGAMHKLIYAQTIHFVNGERELIQGKKYLIVDKQIKCYTYNRIVQNHSTSTVDIIDGPFDNCDCSYPLCHKFQPCGVNTLPIYANNISFEPVVDGYYIVNGECCHYLGTEESSQGVEVTIDEIPYNDCSCATGYEYYECVVMTCNNKEFHFNISKEILHLLTNDIRTFKWNGKCYYLVEEIGNENPELEYMDIELLNGVYEGCIECGTLQKHGDTNNYEEINCTFAESVYNKAMSDKNGVEFCCEHDTVRDIISKILIDEGAKQDEIDLCNINKELQ